MTSDNYPKRVKEKTRVKILKALLKKSPQKWSELLQVTKLSSRTLSRSLKELEKQGSVLRQVKVENGYPPPVYYGLLIKNIEDIEPLIFGEVMPSFLGNYNKQIFEGHGINIEFENDDKIVTVNNFCKRMGVLYLFSLLKSFEKNDLRWTDNILNELGSSNLGYLIILSYILGFNYLKNIPQHGLPYVSSEGEKIMKILNDLYPEEIKDLEQRLVDESNKLRLVSLEGLKL
jgi:DNA-binding HxlR family transcriptional regulator